MSGSDALAAAIQPLIEQGAKWPADLPDDHPVTLRSGTWEKQVTTLGTLRAIVEAAKSRIMPTRQDFEELDPHDFMDKVEAEAREWRENSGGPYSPEASDGQRFGDWQAKAAMAIAAALTAFIVWFVWWMW